MKKKLKFIWIDDDNREIAAENLEKQLGVKCIFVNVKPEDVDFLSLIDKNKPDLIIVDHNLTEIGTGEIKKGSTIAALIRENHPDYAIACITGQDSDSIDSQQRLSYEAIFSYDAITDHYPTMKSIAESYRKLKGNPPKDISELFGLMKVPNEERIRLESILGQEIKENFNDPGIFLNISQWIRNLLFERPGFLYDRLWTATLLGLNEDGFKKVEKLFIPAKYNGIFKDESRDRWWKSELIKILAKHVTNSGLPWEKGRFLPDLTARHFSKDYYSGYKESYPEVVAYLDETTDKRAQMKLKYTVAHPKYDKLLFFEDIRMMKAN
ncbi:MAG: hypothetical protein K9H64_08375 [Bacteroidales bacterium]|nr:hypothetical protein [Bacteroidales bacterium]MCF8455847.1 hypothetical protein [Bacteroidales bacterium]